MLQIEVAGTVIQLEDTEAALIVYCNETWKGDKISLEGDRISPSYSLGVLLPDMSASVISRLRGNETVYAAIFPRIPLGEEIQRKVDLAGGIRYKETGFYPDPKHHQTITIFAGNVIEIDWTEKKDLKEMYLR